MEDDEFDVYGDLEEFSNTEQLKRVPYTILFYKLLLIVCI